MLDWECKEVKKVLKREDFIIEGFIYMSKFPEFIFKGASLLQNINIDINTFLLRETKDIDITNIGLTKDRLKDIVKDFVTYLDKKYDISRYVILENDKTLESEEYYTVDFINREYNEIAFNIDFSVAAEYGQGYLYNFDFDNIIGYNVNKIFSDKMSTISTKQIFSRIKDFVDMYNLSLNDKYLISYDQICRYNELNEDFSVGDFKQLLTMKENIKKAFKKMRKVQILNDFSKEEAFELIYSRVVDFVTPFIVNEDNNFSSSVWDTKSGSWVKIRSR